MANILITYDVSARQIDLKEQLEELGYSDSWSSGGKTYFLPNTTLWKANHSTSQASSEIIAVAKALGITLQRMIVVEFSNWDGIPGQPHS